MVTSPLESRTDLAFFLLIWILHISAHPVSKTWEIPIWEVPARHGGSPKAGWFLRENPIKMKDLGGIPILGHPHIALQNDGFPGVHHHASWVSIMFRRFPVLHRQNRPVLRMNPELWIKKIETIKYSLCYSLSLHISADPGWCKGERVKDYSFLLFQQQQQQQQQQKKKTNKQEVTLGIFRCNSGADSSFGGMVFCCQQGLLVLRLSRCGR